MFEIKFLTVHFVRNFRFKFNKYVSTTQEQVFPWKPGSKFHERRKQNLKLA